MKNIEQSQSAFVPGRIISDNIILNHELIKVYGRKNISPRYMMKIDMQKAYDSVEWIYIEQMLHGLHFPVKFTNWIMSCLRTVSYLININGKPSRPFAAKRGLRQSDPMPHYLFVIVMEYLSRLLKKLTKNPAFKFHPKCVKTKITQLGFADDLLLLCKGDRFCTATIQLL